METAVLEDLGLSKNEIKIYLFLVKSEDVKTGKIIRHTGIASSRVYISLDKLIHRGLVSYFIKNNKKYFNATRPEILSNIFNNKKRQLDHLVIELKKLEKPSPSESSTVIYEGIKGFQNAFERIVQVCSSKDEILTLGFSRPTKGLERLRILLKHIDEKRVKKHIPMKIILSEEVRLSMGKDRMKEKYTEVRFMPSGYFSPSAVNIFKDYVLLELWEEKPTIIFIKNQRIADSFRAYFNVLWNNSLI